MKITNYAEKRLNILKNEMGEIARVFKDGQKLYIEFENGMNIQLHNDEVTHQAIEHLESEKQSLTF